MAWRSAYCDKPRLSRRRRSTCVSLDSERFVLPWERREVFPTLKISNHYEPNDPSENVPSGSSQRSYLSAVAITGMRLYKSSAREFGPVVNIVQRSMTSPSELVHASHSPECEQVTRRSTAYSTSATGSTDV